MMVELQEFLTTPGKIFDVRSPSEHLQGRIPGAITLPLFTDDERAVIGTAYKQQSPDKAIEIGLQYALPKVPDYIAIAKKNMDEGFAKVHCWRGGMRSQSMATLLSNSGMKTVTLKGGYKTYRRWALEQFDETYPLKVLGGFTGCGKTNILHALKEMGEQVLDLEGIANHRGSAFGSLGMPPQPSTEQFQNEVAHQLSLFNKEKPIWIEDESFLIGTCAIPRPFYDQMQNSPLYSIEKSIDERLQNLKDDYWIAPQDQLIAATKKISKKLGSECTNDVIRMIEEKQYAEAATLVLHYYDKAYTYCLAKDNRPTTHVCGKGLSAKDLAFFLRSNLE